MRKPTVTPKPCKAWAAVSPQGHVFLDTVRYLRRDAMAALWRGQVGEAVPWSFWKKDGYTIQRVTITPEGK